MGRRGGTRGFIPLAGFLLVIASSSAPVRAAELRAQAGSGEAAPSGGAVSVTIDLSGGAAYHKEPLLLELEFKNSSEQTVHLDPGAFAPEAFAIADAQGKPARRAPTPESAAAPLDVEGYSTARRTMDLRAWFPDVTSRKDRDWTITWTHSPHAAGPFTFRVIARHDPRKDRKAMVETSLGTMTWTLLPDLAPRHVKRFVDLARQGHYDGLTIFRVIPGIQAEGGDPQGDGTGGWTRLQNPELASKLLMEPGLVGSSRQETTMTSDTMFFITLGQVDFMQGLQTFFARVTGGMEVLARLRQAENRGDTGGRDAFMLVEPVRITRIDIGK